MKTILHRVWVSSAVLGVMLSLTIGCKENAKLGLPVVAEILPVSAAQANPAPPPAEPAKAPSQNETPAPAEELKSAPPAVVPTEPIPLPPTNRVALAPARLPVAPENVQLSPGLEEIITMAQAGISEEVMLSYITNSSNVYRLTSNEIVYLNDMGISSPVITALIERDNAADTMQRKKEAVAAAPLPPGAALSAPATNIYPATTPRSEIVQVPKYPENVDYGIPASQLPPATETPLPEEVTPYAPETGQAPPSDIDYFYSGLSPYGNWYYVPSYGYCWRPTVAVVNYNWRPYCDGGRWLWSTRGWYWYSDYSWGWAPFHYGRWCVYPRLGWMWVPDRVWGPSWVSWRTTRYYCGWAPLPPSCHYVSGFGLYYNNGSVGVSFGFGYGYQYYNFLPYHRFCDSSPYHYYASRSHCKTIYDQSTVVNNYIQGDNNTIINQGVGFDRVASVTRSTIPTVEVRETPAANFDAQGRRERLLSSGNSVSVTSPAPPPGGTTADGRRSRNAPPATGALSTSSTGIPGTALSPSDRSARPGLGRAGVSAASPSASETPNSARPSTRAESPNRRDLESRPMNRPNRLETQTATSGQVASPARPSSEAPPPSELSGQAARARSSRAQSEAMARGNGNGRSSSGEPIIINRGNVFEGSMANPRVTDPSTPAPIIITRPSSRGEPSNRGMVVRTEPRELPSTTVPPAASFDPRDNRNSARGNPRAAQAQPGGMDSSRMAPSQNGISTSRPSTVSPQRGNPRSNAAQFDPGPGQSQGSRFVPRSSNPRPMPAPSPTYSAPPSSGMRSRSEAPSSPSPAPSRPAPSVSQSPPPSQAAPAAPARSSRGSRSNDQGVGGGGGGGGGRGRR